MRVHDWRAARVCEGSRDPADPLAIIGWFSSYIAPKVHRAVCGLADEGPGDRGDPADHDGSAKAALIAIGAVAGCVARAAWRALVAAGGSDDDSAQPFLADLDWRWRERSNARFLALAALCVPALTSPVQWPGWPAASRC